MSPLYFEITEPCCDGVGDERRRGFRKRQVKVDPPRRSQNLSPEATKQEGSPMTGAAKLCLEDSSNVFVLDSVAVGLLGQLPDLFVLDMRVIVWLY